MKSRMAFKLVVGLLLCGPSFVASDNVQRVCYDGERSVGSLADWWIFYRKDGTVCPDGVETCRVLKTHGAVVDQVSMSCGPVCDQSNLELTCQPWTKMTKLNDHPDQDVGITEQLCGEDMCNYDLK